VTLEWLLKNAVKLAQYWQGIGYAGQPSSRADRAALQRLEGSAPVIFDVGANCGQYIQLALDQLADRQTVIHAFEPGRAAFVELERRFRQKSGIFLNNFALGSQAAKQTLYYDVAGSQLSSLYSRRLDQHGRPFTCSEEVWVDTLDNYCDARGIENIDLLKLDVEGHELQVLNGAAQMFRRSSIRLVSFEFGGCNIDSRTFLRDFVDFFAAQGMKLARVTPSGLFPIPNYDESLEQFRTTCFVALGTPRK
jgi:FkbM family methyltransferase